MATAFIRALVAFIGLVVPALQLSATTAPPVHLTSEQDHNRILKLLHIGRTGPLF